MKQEMFLAKDDAELGHRLFPAAANGAIADAEKFGHMGLRPAVI
jgi:hypothetical protein